MTRRAGSHFVIGYGGIVEVPTIEIISTERNVVGNIVGSYNDLAELMALAARARSPCTPSRTRWRRRTTPSTTSTTAGCPGPRDSHPQLEGGAHVREGRREVLRGRRPHALLGRERGEHQANKYGEGFIRCFYDYHRNLSPEEYVWPLEKYRKYDEPTMMKDLFEDGYVDMAIFQPTYLTDFYHKGFNTTEQDAVAQGQVPGQVRPQHLLGAAADGEAGPGPVRGEACARYGLQGREAVHGRVARQLQGLEAHRPVGPAPPGEGPGARRHQHPRPQGPDHLAAEPGLLRRGRRRRRRHHLPRAQLHRRARRPAPAGGHVLDRAPRSRTCTAAWRWRCRSSTPARPTSRQIVGELLYWLGEDRLLFASDYALWHPKWLVEKFVDYQYPMR